MPKIYSDKSSDKEMNPQQKTVQFILDFSRSLRTIRTSSNVMIELNLN
ncbi:hypothetical protein [Tenacibaculum sp. M341]|nr:hypothetical protein [Tenacibaculum sp. M341]